MKAELLDRLEEQIRNELCYHYDMERLQEIDGERRDVKS